MSGHGKGGKGLGKGIPKRHRKIHKENLPAALNKGGCRRLMRRAGCKRISGSIYHESRMVLKEFLEKVLRDAVTYCEHARRTTIISFDVIYALKHQGQTLYGYGK